MKNKYTKSLSLLLCALLWTGTAGNGVVYALGEDTQEEKTEKDLSLVTDEPESDLNKNEIVYVLADAEGGVQKMIVSDWIKNTAGCDSISDRSELTNVENVKGDETYILDGDTIQVWDAQGKDIYYQGDIEKKPPVDVSVSYTLDGESISPSELAGKSGKVTIRFDYTNDEYSMVDIDGSQEKIYVPFAMLTGVLLDAETFTNVEVSNGKLFNDGSHIAVVGMAFPGLQSSLNVDAEQLEIPDYVEITAEVKDFELTNTVTIATNEIFRNLNMEELDSADDLTASLHELTDAMGQLTNGSSQLYDGLCTLLEKSGELISGIDQLEDGALQLKDGSSALSDGATELAAGADTLANGASSLADGTAQLVEGAKALAGGLDTLVSNNDTLNGGAQQVFESLLKMADSQLAAAGLTLPELTIDSYAQVLDGVMESLGQENVEAIARISALKEQLDSYHQFYMGLNQYTAGVASAKDGADQLCAGTDQVNDGAVQVCTGSSQVRDGAGELKTGSAELCTGMSGLYDGILTLQNGAPDLTDGVTQLRDGAMQLSDGLKEFNENGVQKLADAVDGDIRDLIMRVKATGDVSKDYRTFSGLSDDMDGQVTFIYRTEAIDEK